MSSVECHLARVQLRRILAGEELPDELMLDLEQHLKTCAECMAEARQQKAALLGEDAPVDKAPGFLARIKDARSPKFALPLGGRNTRIAVLTTLFAVLTIGMAWFSKSGVMAGMLGPTVAEKAKAESKATKPAPTPEADVDAWMDESRVAMNAPTPGHEPEPYATGEGEALQSALEEAKLAMAESTPATPEQTAEPTEAKPTPEPTEDADTERHVAEPPATPGNEGGEEVIVGTPGPRPHPKASAAKEPSPPVKKTSRPRSSAPKRPAPRKSSTSKKARSNSQPVVPVYNSEGKRIN